MLKALCLIAVSALVTSVLAAEEPAPDVLTFDQIFAPNRPGEWPKQLRFTQDGSRLGYLLPAETGGQELWLLDVASGESQAHFASTSLPKKGDDAASIDSYAWTPSGDLFVQSGGDLYLASGSGAPRRLTSTAAEEDGARLSPDGARVAYSRGGNLHVLELASGRERALTTDGDGDRIRNGQADWVYWEEIWNRSAEALWWSPDGRRLAFYRFDDTNVERYPLTDFSPLYPSVHWQRYPKAGETNPRVRIGVIDVAKGKPKWLETGDPEAYLARVVWHPKGDKLVVERLNRDQTQLDLLLCDAKTGACSPLYSETARTWINLGDDLTLLSDGRFLRTSQQKDGYRQIFLHAANGTIERPLTQPTTSRVVDQILGVDEEAGWVAYQSHVEAGISTAYRQVMRVSLRPETAQEPPVPLSGETGWNEGLFAARGGAWVLTRSTAAKPQERIVKRGDGSISARLPTGPEAAFDPASFPTWETVTIWGIDGGKLPARLLRPKKIPPGEKLPALMYHYGGPGSQVISDRWEGRARDLFHRRMAQRGYVVLTVENLGTAFFGKRGEDRMHRDFGQLNTDAQLAGVEYLKTLPYVDASRIGLWGWSGGGTNTLMAVLTKPGVWKAAVAGAPVTDWRLYDSIWTERYLDLPADNEKGYRASSPLTHAANLADHLLLVHGLADDNVHPQNSIVMAKALVEAGKLFEEAYYHGQSHGLTGKAERHFYERMTEFFDRWLR